MPRTGTSGAKLEGASKIKRRQKAEERVWTHRSGTSGAEQATGAAAPGLEHPGGKEQQDPPPAALGHPGTKGGKTHQTGSSGTEQAGGASSPGTGSSRDKRRPHAPDWIVRVGTSRRTRHIPDRIIRGKATRSSHNPQGRIIRRNEACRPGQGCRGRIQRKESSPPRLECPRENGGQRQKKQEAKAKVGQQRSHVWRQRKGKRHGDAVTQR